MSGKEPAPEDDDAAAAAVGPGGVPRPRKVAAWKASRSMLYQCMFVAGGDAILTGGVDHQLNCYGVRDDADGTWLAEPAERWVVKRPNEVDRVWWHPGTSGSSGSNGSGSGGGGGFTGTADDPLGSRAAAGDRVLAGCDDGTIVAVDLESGAVLNKDNPWRVAEWVRIGAPMTGPQCFSPAGGGGGGAAAAAAAAGGGWGGGGSADAPLTAAAQELGVSVGESVDTLSPSAFWAGGRKGNLCLFDVRKPGSEPVARVNLADGDHLWALALAPDGYNFFVGGNEVVHCADVRRATNAQHTAKDEPARVACQRTLEGQVRGLSVSASGKTLFVTGPPGLAALSLENPQEAWKEHTFDDVIAVKCNLEDATKPGAHGCAFDTERNQLVVGHDDGKLGFYPMIPEDTGVLPRDPSMMFADGVRVSIKDDDKQRSQVRDVAIHRDAVFSGDDSGHAAVFELTSSGRRTKAAGRR